MSYILTDSPSSNPTQFLFRSFLVLMITQTSFQKQLPGCSWLTEFCTLIFILGVGWGHFIICNMKGIFWVVWLVSDHLPLSFSVYLYLQGCCPWFSFCYDFVCEYICHAEVTYCYCQCSVLLLFILFCWGSKTCQVSKEVIACICSWRQYIVLLQKRV